MKKKKYDSRKLSQKQKHMKKWIPSGPYCEGYGVGKYPGPCPFYKDIASLREPYKHKREECQFKNTCEVCDCSNCTEQVSKCDFLNYIEYGQYPLGDMCKVCGIHMEFPKDMRRNAILSKECLKNEWIRKLLKDE